MNVRELFDRKRAEAAAQVDAAEQRALEAGKQPFVLAEFEELLGRGPQNERERRTEYYVFHPEMQTMMELVDLIERMSPWEDSR